MSTHRQSKIFIPDSLSPALGELLKVSHCQVTITKTTFQNFTSVSSLICVQNRSKVTLKQVHFKGNGNRRPLSLISVSSFSSAQVDSSDFVWNKAANISVGTNCKLSIRASTFLQNVVHQGEIIHLADNSNFELEMSAFISTKVREYYGCVIRSGNSVRIRVQTSTFYSNEHMKGNLHQPKRQRDWSDSLSVGKCSDVSIADSVFEQNYDFGMDFAENVTVRIYNCTFLNNSHNNRIQRSAIHCSGEQTYLQIAFTVFHSIRATEAGFTLISCSHFLVHGSKFIQSNATGIIYCFECDGKIESCLFTHNTVWDALVLSLGGKGTIVNNCTFDKNTGSAITFMRDSRFSLVNSNFTGNVVSLLSSLISVHDYASAQMKNCSFTNNTSSVISVERSKIDIVSCEFSNYVLSRTDAAANPYLVALQDHSVFSAEQTKFTGFYYLSINISEHSEANFSDCLVSVGIVVDTNSTLIIKNFLFMLIQDTVNIHPYSEYYSPRKCIIEASKFSTVFLSEATVAFSAIRTYSQPTFLCTKQNTIINVVRTNTTQCTKAHHVPVVYLNYCAHYEFFGGFVRGSNTHLIVRSSNLLDFGTLELSESHFSITKSQMVKGRLIYESSNGTIDNCSFTDVGISTQVSPDFSKIPAMNNYLIIKNSSCNDTSLQHCVALHSTLFDRLTVGNLVLENSVAQVPSPEGHISVTVRKMSLKEVLHEICMEQPNIRIKSLRLFNSQLIFQGQLNHKQSKPIASFGTIDVRQALHFNISKLVTWHSTISVDHNTFHSEDKNFLQMLENFGVFHNCFTGRGTGWGSTVPEHQNVMYAAGKIYCLLETT